ncbi:hypothetical protein CsSME_00011902 [Camellia sinensis var. sinensis]
MSGQFTESCQTHKGANRNQCRDSLQSLVGPIKELTGINVGTVYRVLSDPLKNRILKRCAQFIKRRAIKRRAIKRRAIKRRVHFIKRCAMKRRASLSGVKRRAMRVAASAI